MQNEKQDEFSYMDLPQIVAHIQARKIPVMKLCEMSKISDTTLLRWKRFMKTGTGTCPNMRTLRRVREALRRYEEQISSPA